MKNKTYQNIYNTQIYDWPHSSLGTDTSKICGGVKLVYGPKTVLLVMWYGHASVFQFQASYTNDWTVLL
jgi:hypothetical protein